MIFGIPFREVPLSFKFKKSSKNFSNIYAHVEQAFEHGPNKEIKYDIDLYENFEDVFEAYSNLKPLMGPGIDIIISGAWLKGLSKKYNHIYIISEDREKTLKCTEDKLNQPVFLKMKI